MNDIFRPMREPARSIYDVFQAEASKRKGRSIDEWMTAERGAVFREACRLAALLNLRTPTIDDIMRAERYAVGSSDYGAQWAYKVVEAMQSTVIAH